MGMSKLRMLGAGAVVERLRLPGTDAEDIRVMCDAPFRLSLS